MKKTSYIGLLVASALLCVAIAVPTFVSSCATVKHVVSTANNPDAAVGAVVANCVKPEIADQVANAVAGINQIIADPSKTAEVKAQEISALKAGGEEVLACALREGISEITAMIRNAAGKNAAVDPRVVDAKTLMEKLAAGYSYADGWGGSGGASGSDGGSRD